MTIITRLYQLIQKQLLKNKTILDTFSERVGQVAILIDPEKSHTASDLDELIKKAEFAQIDFFFVGGSTVTREDFTFVVHHLKKRSIIPVVIFPGASHQISEEADALLYLSLISGRNPDYLIGHHVSSANEVYNMDCEIISTGYILIDGGTKSSVAYVSQTTPIPVNQISIIMNTAKAGILQGKKLIYLDAGSGALNHVPENVVSNLTTLRRPIIVGGGIKTEEQIENLANAGANVIVIGNKIETDIDFLMDIHSFVKNRN